MSVAVCGYRTGYSTIVHSVKQPFQPVLKPIKYDLLSVDPDVIRYAWDSRRDYCVVALGDALRSHETASIILSWLRDHIDSAIGSSVPPVVEAMAGSLCEGGTGKTGVRRCGQCLRCGFVITPIDAFCLEMWLEHRTDVVPEVVTHSDGPNQNFVALWGLLTITWTWDALVCLLTSDELEGSGVPEDAFLWSLMLRYLTLKSPRAALQALADRAHPDDVTVTMKDFIPLLKHDDYEIRQIAVGLIPKYFKNR